MRYIVGLVFFAAGAWLMWSALARRRRAIAAGPAAQPEIRQSLQIIGDALPPIIVIALVIIGAKMSLAFFVTDAGRHLSLLDLAGFLFLLAGYGTSVVLRTRYHEPVAVRAVADPAPRASSVNLD